jgi:hypothetical protein
MSFWKTKTIKISEMTYAESFLLENGFHKMEANSYANDVCNVILNKEDNIFEVANNEGDVMYSNDESIYWLIGYLTFCRFIDQNYKLP